jgi:hypothetical protein
VQANLRSANDFRANAAIAAIIQEYLAATIGGYREHVRSPSQPPPRALSERLTSGLTSFRTRFVDTKSPGAEAGSAEVLNSAAKSTSTQDTTDDVIIGDNGFKFYHASFVASFTSRVGRDFAIGLLHTQLWQVCTDMLVLQYL